MRKFNILVFLIAIIALAEVAECTNRQLFIISLIKDLIDKTKEKFEEKFAPKPVTPAKPVEPVKPVQPVKPVEPVKPV